MKNKNKNKKQEKRSPCGEMNYITRRTKKGTEAVPLTNFIISLKYFIGGLFGLHFHRTSSEFSTFPAIYLRINCTHIIWFPLVHQPIKLSLCSSHLSIVQQRCALDDLSIEPKGSIYLNRYFNCTHKSKNKTRLKCEAATILKSLVARYTPTHSLSTYY